MVRKSVVNMAKSILSLLQTIAFILSGSVQFRTRGHPIGKNMFSKSEFILLRSHFFFLFFPFMTSFVNPY